MFVVASTMLVLIYRNLPSVRLLLDIFFSSSRGIFTPLPPILYIFNHHIELIHKFFFVCFYFRIKSFRVV